MTMTGSMSAHTAPGAPRRTGKARAAERRPPGAIDALDRAIIRATQAGLPLSPDPWATIGAEVGAPGEEVRRRIEAMLARGIIRRIAAVPNHYALGLTANGMSVWDVDDAHIARLGAAVGALDFVSHCYERPRRPPQWRYNLFAMVHGTTRAEVEKKVARIAALLGPHARAHDILYSTRIIKKTGLRLGP